MGIFKGKNGDDNDYYDEFDVDDESEEETIKKFSQPAPKRRSYDPNSSSVSSQGRQQSRPSSSSSYSAPSSASSSKSSYQPPMSTPKQSAPSYYSPPAPVYKVEPDYSRRKVDELFIATLTQTNDAISVADLVKEKRYALIIDVNPLKALENKAEYASVINFIDGVCYVTDSELKEIVEGCGIYLIYHKDIVLNEGFDLHYQSSGYKY